MRTRTIGLSVLLALVPSSSFALTLDQVEVPPGAIECMFDPNCSPVATETTADIILPGGVGAGLMRTRSFTGGPSSQLKGFHGYQYVIDLTGMGGNACISSYDIAFDRPTPADYDGNGDLDHLYVSRDAARGGVMPDAAQIAGKTITLLFYGGLCAGETSATIGLTSPIRAGSVRGLFTESISAALVDIDIFGPLINPCLQRPDLNSDFSPAERDVLDDLVLDYIDVSVIDDHFTPGIHSTTMLLPWHRDYIDGLEDFLVLEGFPEFVPFPAWDAANPIPAEFQDVDADCPISLGPGSCAALVDTDPMVSRPAHLERPDLCDYADRDELTSGGVDVSRPGLNGYHGSAHISIGGAMGAFRSPSANIFWGHHSNIDNIWLEWECDCDSILIPPYFFDLLPFDLLTPCRLTPCWAGWWRMEDPLLFDPHALMPMMLKDSRGADNAGIPEGDPRSIVGMVGTALEFDGVDDALRVPHHAEMEIGLHDFAIDAWVLTKSRVMQPIMEKRLPAGPGFALFLDLGLLSFEMSDGSASLKTGAGSPPIADGQWHHVAVSVDRDDPMGGRLYVDGKIAHTFDPTGVQGMIQPQADLFIARGAAPAPGGPPSRFMGSLDELDLFRRALKPAELRGIHGAGGAGKYGGLRGVTPVVVQELCTSPAAGERGARVSIPIVLDDGAGVAGFQVDVGFDPSALTPTGVRLGADTTAAGGWQVAFAPIGAGVVRVLGSSNPPAALAPGPREVALLDLAILTGAPSGVSPLTLDRCVLGDPLGERLHCRLCGQPGGVAVRTVATFQFDPIGSPLGVDKWDPLPFRVSAEALGSSGLRATGYNGTADMDVIEPPFCPGTLVPSMLGFTAGLGGPDTFEVACCLDDLLPETAAKVQIEALDRTNGASGLSDPLLGVAKGDLDASGIVTVLDVTRTMLLALAQPLPPSPPAGFQVWAADMNDEHCQVDGGTDVLDVIRVRNKALGMHPLCDCDGPFHTTVPRTRAQGAIIMSLVSDPQGGRLLMVSGAEGLSGIQIELRTRRSDVSVEAAGLLAGAGWEIAKSRQRGAGVTIVAYAPQGEGISGSGALLRLKGGGRVALTSVTAADAEGRSIPIQ